jgi:RNA polymerase sigma-70 factor (ECF subfamily)
VAVDGYVKKIREESFKAFYEKHSRSLWFFIYKTCGDESMADDIFQESFYKYLKAEPVKLNEYQQKAYLFMIAYRLIIDQVRKTKVRLEKFTEMETDPGFGFEASKEQEISTALDMEKTFKLLEPKERTLLWLAYAEGYSHKEIAAIIHTKEKTINVKLFRVKKKFANILRQQGYNGEVKN